MIERVCAFSDTHTYHRQVSIPACDLLIFAGDCMGSGHKRAEMIDFLDWFSGIPARYKVMVAGNHDRFVENHAAEFRRLLNTGYPGLIYLEDSGVDLEGFKLWGTPHTKEFHHWAFNRSPAEKEILFAKIPDDTEILITHGPARGILDQVEKGVCLGEQELLEVITDRLPKLKLHFFGHIHAGHGQVQRERYRAFNCAICTEAYIPENLPHQIDLCEAFTNQVGSAIN
jgi:calcineurin-like phosphoesterase family protein